MDIKTIRKMNVRLLEREIGSLSALARLAGSSQSYLSQCVGPNAFRSIGDEMARRLEHAMKKPHGWMDEGHMEEGQVALARQIYDKLLQPPAAKLHAIAELLDMKRAAMEGLEHLTSDGQSSHETKGRVITLEDDATHKKTTKRGQSK
ncbi:Phage-related protein [Cupriavidus necator]|uniref:Phage-related protein n=1 Tax=Cupriavidus necator TaxID=106590 RepID=A0A1K0IED3_CUPNE|nr:Phage-related protein [Cupriavidus necator]